MVVGHGGVETEFGAGHRQSGRAVGHEEQSRVPFGWTSLHSRESEEREERDEDRAHFLRRL